MGATYIGVTDSVSLIVSEAGTADITAVTVTTAISKRCDRDPAAVTVTITLMVKVMHTLTVTLSRGLREDQWSRFRLENRV